MTARFLAARIWLIVIAAGAAAQLAAFWPGVTVWDSIHQYDEARSGHFRDWHPPAMAWLWRQLDAVVAGPAPMLVLQAALYWTGFALLAGAAARGGRPRVALALAACALLPIPYLLVGTILKDSLMAGALLTAAGLAAWRRPGRRWPAVVAAALLLGAATLRFNAVPACLPIAAALLPAGWSWRRKGVTLAVAVVALASALPLANRTLRAEPSGVELSLAIYDLGGIAHFSGAEVFPGGRSAVAARCWSPVSWDSYSWWVDAPCPVGFERVRRALAGSSTTRWWLGAIVAHPAAYVRHRLAHSGCNLRVGACAGALPGLSLQSDPNSYGFHVDDTPLRRAIDDVAVAALATPLGWPICWLAVAAACLVLRPASPLAWSALLYGLSYLPLSVASEVRYHLWTMTAAALAAVLTLAERPTRRRLAAGLTLAIPIAGAVAAHALS